MAGHVAPEAERGGPIALLRDGDIVRIDVAARRLDADIDLRARSAEFAGPRSTRVRGVLAKYAALVSSASEGAVTRAPEFVGRPPDGAAPVQGEGHGSRQ